MDLVLIRHGRSAGDDEGVVEGGGYDAPLSEEGRRQARVLSERLALEGYRFDVLFASPLKRAHEVAEIIAGKLGVEVILDTRLREIHTGKIAGLPPVAVARIQPEPPGGYRTYEPIPEGESTIDHYSRALSFYCELLDKHLGDSVCVVAHGGTLGHLLRIIYGNPVNSPIVGRGYLCFMNGDTAISRLTINGPKDVLTHFLNDESHLRGAKPRRQL